MIKKRETVEILAEYQDEGDDTFVRKAVSDEEKGRVVDISPVSIAWAYPPISTVKSSWIKVILAASE